MKRVYLKNPIDLKPTVPQIFYITDGNLITQIINLDLFNYLVSLGYTFTLDGNEKFIASNETELFSILDAIQNFYS